MLSVKDIRAAAMQQGFKLMGNPRVMKIIGDPRFMKAISGAFEFRSKVNAAVDDRVHRLAKRLNLATKSEVNELKDTISDLEAKVSGSGSTSSS